jgi:hypothetical protein
VAIYLVNYNFTLNAQSFAATPGTHSVMAWASGNSGSLSTTTSGHNTTSITDNNHWTLSTTWQGIGIPVGSTITAVTSCRISGQCIVYSNGSASSAGPTTIVDGATTIAMTSGFRFTATTSLVAQSGSGATGLSLPSSDSISINIMNVVANGSAKPASVILQQTQLGFLVTYTPPTPISTMAPIRGTYRRKQ